MSQSFTCAIEWASAPAKGRIQVHHGRLESLSLARGEGTVKGDHFTFAKGTSGRLLVRVAEAALEAGALATRVQVECEPRGFTFFARDVSREYPIVSPHLGIAVTAAADRRDYRGLADAVAALGAPSEADAIEAAPEETYEAACAANRALVGPIWLGLARDMRIFSFSYETTLGYFGGIEPRYHATVQNVEETKNQPYILGFAVGRGAGCRVDIERRLDEGALPILRAVQRDEDVEYHLTVFVTLEKSPLGPQRVRGTHWLALYANSAGRMLTPQEQQRYEQELLQPEVRQREEETVCVVRVEAVNRAAVPRYAFMKGLHLSRVGGVATRYEPALGALSFSDSGRVLGLQMLDGKPLPQEEVAVLLQPGRTATFDYVVPHQPLSPQRAAKLAKLEVAEHLRACREFWRAKLASAASVTVPEQAIDDRIKAGLLHLDIVAYGREPAGAVAATIGVYSPIGSESSPIIQFMDSMGWHSLARRCIQFFLERQRQDGFIQTFGGYQLETGPFLWTLGEHYRYTRDDAWARRVAAKAVKSADFILDWRNRNKKPELRGKGYGLLDGKVADPEDFFHSFMLNGLAYAGVQRVAEMLQGINPAEARRLAREADAFKRDIRQSFLESLANSPLIPTGDGTWVPSAPPWAEYPGPVGLFAEGGNWFTHGAIGARDSLIGALYLVIGEVLDAREPAAEMLLKQHQVLNTMRNAGFSQPYYCRHDYAHLLRGEVKQYLKTYYNQFTALQDRQSLSFWEHYFHASPHKTHEEGWFLMQTRWLLYHEQGDAMRLLPMVPRRWLEDGKEIHLGQWASYFGKFSLDVVSQVAAGAIQARVKFDPRRAPTKVMLRLPHPDGRKARAASAGVYNPADETVTLKLKAGVAEVNLRF